MAPATSPPPTLLVIEDNDFAREALTILLRKAGYRVVALHDGGTALEYLRAGNRPDLILLDMLMPVVDGWHFLEDLRHWSKPLKVPIIVTTGTILTREWATQNGCAGFLRKPIETKELLAEVQRCLG